MTACLTGLLENHLKDVDLDSVAVILAHKLHDCDKREHPDDVRKAEELVCRILVNRSVDLGTDRTSIAKCVSLVMCRSGGTLMAFQECHIPSSCAIPQPCLPERTSVTLVVWCPALLASTSFLRSGELSPFVRRFCRVADRIVGQRFLGISGFRPNTRNRFSPLVLRLWLNISQDFLQHEIKQLGMMFHCC